MYNECNAYCSNQQMVQHKTQLIKSHHLHNDNTAIIVQLETVNIFHFRAQTVSFVYTGRWQNELQKSNNTQSI